MAGITPIPTTRVGDYFIRQRLMNQVLGDQLDLFRLQTQVSTGRRILRPSDDAPAALRAIALQRTIQRKEQSQRNLDGSRTVLSVAETSLNSVASTISNIRATALESVSNLTSESARTAAIADINAALQAMVTAGNANYNGRYLFSGSRTSVSPFTVQGDYVQYSGNEKSLQNYVDLEQLFTTNIPGTDIFGGVSGEVRGSVDLNPQLTSNTLLTSINGGDGINTSAAISIHVTNGSTTTSSVVDLSGAVTVGDVIRRIEANPPASGATLRVEIADNGLTLRTSAGTVRVAEVAAGRAAKELGIFTPVGSTLSSSIVGTDLKPVLRNTTALSDLLGVKATGRLVAVNANNDLALRANQNGVDLNGVTVVYTSGGVAGSEVATYDSGTKTLTVQIEDGESNANQVVAAINAEGTFTAALDGRDTTTNDLAGTGKVNLNNFGVVIGGGSGESLDTSGLVLTNGIHSATVEIDAARTVEDLFNLIAGAGVGLVGEINASGDGINIRSTLSGASFSIGENGGTTATQLGIRSYNASTQLADFNRGVGVITNDAQDSSFPAITSDLQITARDGVALTVDIDSATSLADVVTLINNAAGNHTGTTAVTASLTSDGRGIRLIDSSTATTGPLVVQGNAAAEALGFVSPSAAGIADSTADVAGDYSLASYQANLRDDFTIVARDGTELRIDATGATTVQDILDRINNHPRNHQGTTAVQARLATTNNGIELVDTSAGATGDLIVRAGEGSEVAQLLGFVPEGATEARSSSGVSGSYSLTSEDRHTYEVDSIFNSLIRLRTAIQAGDESAIGDAVERLDSDFSRLTFARGEIGSRMQTLDVVQTRLEDEGVQLKSALSEEIDVDLVEAISNLTAKQYALQASLQTAGNLLNMSILDFI